jgi:hypothetical protein
MVYLCLKSASAPADPFRMLASAIAIGGQKYANDYTLKWFLWWRFRKAIHRPGGWGGTDRLGVLYEWRVIRPEVSMFLNFSEPTLDD